MISAVGSGGNGFKGGALLPAASPLDVRGAGFNGVGSAAAPPNVPTTSFSEARQNRGSNITVPYARVVPLHGPGEDPRVPGQDPNARKRKYPPTDESPEEFEYDGLRSGVLAFILGKRKCSEAFHTAGGAAPYQAAAGAGYGVARMQRLASFLWLRAAFADVFGAVMIEVNKLDASEALNRSRAVAFNRKIAATGLRRDSPNEPLPAGDKFGAGTANGVATPMLLPGYQGGSAGGVVACTTSPFLHGLGNRKSDSNFVAFDALVQQMMNIGLLEWRPDGVVLSALESPSGEPFKSTEIDARQAQLFNLAIQGPAITKTWTFESKFTTQPGDKVFVCVTALADWTAEVDKPGTPGAVGATQWHSPRRLALAVDAAEEALAEAEKAKAMETQLTGELAILDGAATVSGSILAATAAVAAATVGPQKTALEKSRDALTARKAVVEAKINLAGTVGDKVAAVTTAKDAFKLVVAALAKDAVTGSADAKLLTDVAATATTEAAATPTNKADMDALYTKMKAGGAEAPGMLRTRLRNFELMLSTSSHMVNYSGKNGSRCGLPLYALTAETDVQGMKCIGGSGRYIVGAWCIGTVLDSAASRAWSGQGNMVKTSARTYALNINVNIEWWGADRLHQAYDGKGVRQRGQQ